MGHLPSWVISHLYLVLPAVMCLIKIVIQYVNTTIPAENFWVAKTLQVLHCSVFNWWSRLQPWSAPAQPNINHKIMNPGDILCLDIVWSGIRTLSILISLLLSSHLITSLWMQIHTWCSIFMSMLNRMMVAGWSNIGDGVTMHFPLWLTSFWSEIHKLWTTIHDLWVRLGAWLMTKLHQKKALQRHMCADNVNVLLVGLPWGHQQVWCVRHWANPHNVVLSGTSFHIQISAKWLA